MLLLSYFRWYPSNIFPWDSSNICLCLNVWYPFYAQRLRLLILKLNFILKKSFVSLKWTSVSTDIQLYMIHDPVQIYFVDKMRLSNIVMIIRFDKVYHITTNKMCHQCNVYFPLYLGNCLINMCVSQKKQYRVLP